MYTNSTEILSIVFFVYRFVLRFIPTNILWMRIDYFCNVSEYDDSVLLVYEGYFRKNGTSDGTDMVKFILVFEVAG